MQSNWAALQTKMKGKGRKAPRPEKRVEPEASGSRQDARVTKKRKTKHARRQANDDDATRGRSSEETPETPAASRRTHAKPSHDSMAVRFDGDDAVPRASAPLRPSDDARILDDTAPLAPERRRAFSAAAAASASRDAAGDGVSQDLRAAPVEAARLEAVSHLCFAFERAASNLLGANRWANAFEELMLAHDARDDPLVPTDDAARAFCAERFARARLAETAVETELTYSEARRAKNAIEIATASVVAAVRRARDAIARAAIAIEPPERGTPQTPFRSRAFGWSASTRRRRRARGTPTPVPPRPRACACGWGRPRWSSAPSTSRSWRACGTATGEPPVRRRKPRRRRTPLQKTFAKPTFAATRVSCARRSRARRAWWPRKGACTAWPVGTTPRFTVRCSTCLNTARFVSRLSCSRRL
jgi:hypothetical protein